MEKYYHETTVWFVVANNHSRNSSLQELAKACSRSLTFALVSYGHPAGFSSDCLWPPQPPSHRCSQGFFSFRGSKRIFAFHLVFIPFWPPPKNALALCVWSCGIPEKKPPFSRSERLNCGVSPCVFSLRAATVPICCRSFLWFQPLQIAHLSSGPFGLCCYPLIENALKFPIVPRSCDCSGCGWGLLKIAPSHHYF